MAALAGEGAVLLKHQVTGRSVCRIGLVAMAAAALCACGSEKRPPTKVANDSPRQNSAAAASNAAAVSSPPGTSAATQAAPVGLGTITRAQAEAASTPEFDKCMDTGDAKAGVTAAMLDCMGAENQRQDARLNAAYKALLDRSDPAAREKIRADERAWLKKRKAFCDAPSEDSGGGTADSLNRSGCYIDTTIEQTTALTAR